VALALFHDTGPMPAKTGAPALAEGGLTLAEALRDRRFWTMAAGFLIVSFALAGPAPNLEKMLVLGGIAPAAVIKLTSLIGLSALTGRLIGGWMVDRLWAPGVAFVILSAPALSCWLLASAVLTIPVAAFAICLIGFALGVEYDLMAFFIARYFGMRSYTAIYGVMYVFFSLGAGSGPLVFGLDVDAHGSFRLALLSAVGVLLITGLLFLTLGKYRTFAPHPANAAAV
jgi:MFS family permease